MVTRKPKKDALALWDQEMADAALASAKEVASLGGGQFISTRGGIFKLGDAVIGHEMAVVVVDAQFEYSYYQGDYDPEQRSAPACYAFGHDVDSIKPHEAVKAPVCDSCKLCDYNQWGSADKGRGKKCRNRVRMAVVSAGEMVNGRFEPSDAETFAAAPLAMLGIPTTSMGSWAAYVKALASTKKLPPFGAVTKLEVQPDDKTMLTVLPSFVAKIDAGWIEALREKRTEAADLLDAPYPEGDEEAPKRGRKKAGKKTTKRKRKFA